MSTKKQKSSEEIGAMLSTGRVIDAAIARETRKAAALRAPKRAGRRTSTPRSRRRP